MRELEDRVKAIHDYKVLGPGEFVQLQVVGLQSEPIAAGNASGSLMDNLSLGFS
jgi:hypothetical protein